MFHQNYPIDYMYDQSIEDEVVYIYGGDVLRSPSFSNVYVVPHDM